MTCDDVDWVPRFVDPDCIQRRIDTVGHKDIKTVEELADVGDEVTVAVAVAASTVRTEDDDV